MSKGKYEVCDKEQKVNIRADGIYIKKGKKSMCISTAGYDETIWVSRSGKGLQIPFDKFYKEIANIIDKYFDKIK